MYPYIIQGNTISIAIDGKLHTVNDSHLSYQRIKESIKAGDWDAIPSLIDAKLAIKKYAKDNFEIDEHGSLYKDGEVLNGVLATKIVELYSNGFDIEPLLNFYNNLQNNPSKRAVDELYTFLETAKLPITPDGHFLAYKKVNDSYRDVHSNTVLNKPAKLMSADERKELPMLGVGVQANVDVQIINNELVVSMPRNGVDDQKENHCSHGLHFCSYSYLRSFSGTRVVVVKINPADVVSIPTDYNFSKGRCSRYVVLSEIGGDTEQAFTKPVQESCNTEVVEQEYDSKGRPLSMTPNAIRKRKARAAKKLAK